MKSMKNLILFAAICLFLTGCPTPRDRNPVHQEKSSFNCGDIVHLKSGGPNMTVTGFGFNGYNPIIVSWTDTYGAPHTENYPSASLALVEK